MTINNTWLIFANPAPEDRRTQSSVLSAAFTYTSSTRPRAYCAQTVDVRAMKGLSRTPINQHGTHYNQLP